MTVMTATATMDQAPSRVPTTRKSSNARNLVTNRKPTAMMSSPASSSHKTCATEQSSIGSTTLSTTTTRANATPDLRDNLMRRQKKDRDPALFYETIKVLGFGSMGSVAKVKKRDAVVGGSSRQEYVTEIHGLEGVCFSLPLIGTLLRNLTGKDIGHRVRRGRDLFEETTSCPASTCLLVQKKASYYYALKTIHVNRVQDEAIVQELYNEIDILKTLDHPNIVRPIETFHYQENACIVMELCQGGDLFARDPYTEPDALRIVASVLSALEYMHSKNIIHRDLKYENIMFCGDSPTSDVKVIDFGLSKKYLPTDRLKQGCGTIYSMAPEVIRGDYDQAADLWSMGVVVFMLLSSCMPFYGPDRQAIMKQILSGKYTTKGKEWSKLSEEAKRFVSNLLVLEPTDRPSAREAQRDDWICQSLSTTSISSDDQEMEEMVLAMAAMEVYAGYSKLKKLALLVIAHKATSQDIGFLRRIFDNFDKDHSGRIEESDFQEALEEFGFKEDEILKMFAGCDLDGTGVIQYTEFLAATIEVHGAIPEEALAEAFDRMDSDDSGYISTHNLQEILGEFVPSDHIEGIILEAESELNYSDKVKRQIKSKPAKNHFISYEEFMALWNQGQRFENKRCEALQTIKRRSNMVHNCTLLSIQESVPMKDITISVSEEDDSGSASDLSLDTDPMAISQFQGEKEMSVRKYTQI